MFKPKRHRTNLRKTSKEDDSDSGVVVNIEEIKKQQKMRNEVKSGVTTETLLTGMNVVIDPLTKRVLTSDDAAKKEKSESKERRDEDSDSSEEDEEIKKKMIRYRTEENAIYEPEGFVLSSLAPEPVTEHHIVKEIESEESRKCNTLEDIALMKIQLSKQLRRERREMYEKKKM